MAKLELHNLQKKYSAKVIPVRDISLDVEDGEFLTLLGPSGCGKSTLLRLIAGLEEPTQGKVVIGGKNMNVIAPGDRNIAMVFQSYALYPHMTVKENISSSLKLRRFSLETIQQRVNEVANKLGLENLLARKPSQLSGGQRQRVALARALVRQPDVFLLDEPLSNLDALLREQVRAELKQLFKTQNKPVVYVTHDQTEAMTLSNKVAILDNGLIQQIAPPHHIYTHPANQFVASFIGSPQMNLLTLSCKNNQAILGDLKINLPPSTTTGKTIILGVRPEDICLAKPEDTQIFQGYIILVENLGKEKILSFKIQNSDLIIRALFAADSNFQGDEITLTIPPQKMHWFDTMTGDRILNC